MTAWLHLTTIFNQRRALRTAGLLTLCVALITTLFFVATSRVHAVPNVTRTISFQGRLLSATGAVVPDGHYNLQFKIYQGGAGSAAGNPGGTLKWTENYINNGGTSGVQVKNGYWAVDLGSVNPFGTSVDWDNDTLWLSMNVAGTAASCTTFGSGPCTADGEMLPMKRVSVTPYALNAGSLDGIDSTGFIQNTTVQQTADFNILGTGKATTLQGNTSVIAPLFDRADAGALNIGTVNASTINLGTNNGDHTINIGNGTGTQAVRIGNKTGGGVTAIQGGAQGVYIESAGGFHVLTAISGRPPFMVDSFGNVNFFTNSTSVSFKDDSDNNTLKIDNSGVITAGTESALEVLGTASFNKGITLQGSTGGLNYVTPLGGNLPTAINIPNYTVPQNGSVLAFGLPSTSHATARGLVVADGRTGSHSATIGVLSPNETATLGLSWKSDAGTGANPIGTLSSTANSLALQGNGLNLLTATNNGGAANVGIGNTASNGYALDVTGNTNVSGNYYIGGSSVLASNALNFYGATASTITSANGQSLNVNGKNGVKVQVNGTNAASFGSTNIQIGSGTGSGQPMLLTLDKASSTPSASGSGFIGSMYYDTTKGAVQCYNASGWGACASSPDSFVTFSPEYAGAVLQGTGDGTMTAGLCSDTLHINDGTSGQPTICGSNETYNFYKWTSPNAANQTYSIYVTYQLPSAFTSFVAGSTSLMGRTDSTNSSVSYDVYRKSSSGLTACGTTTAVSTGVKTTWQNGVASGSADPSTCGFVAGDSILVKVNVTAKSNANAYAGTLNFAFSNH